MINKFNLKENVQLRKKTSHVKVKHLCNIFYVPSLVHNLFSVGQVMNNSYSILFDNALRTIKEKSSEQIIVNVQMMANKIFSLKTFEY